MVSNKTQNQERKQSAFLVQPEARKGLEESGMEPIGLGNVNELALGGRIRLK